MTHRRRLLVGAALAALVSNTTIRTVDAEVPPLDGPQGSDYQWVSQFTLDSPEQTKDVLRSLINNNHAVIVSHSNPTPYSLVVVYRKGTDNARQQEQEGYGS